MPTKAATSRAKSPRPSRSTKKAAPVVEEEEEDDVVEVEPKPTKSKTKSRSTKKATPVVEEEEEDDVVEEAPKSKSRAKSPAASKRATKSDGIINSCISTFRDNFNSFDSFCNTSIKQITKFSKQMKYFLFGALVLFLGYYADEIVEEYLLEGWNLIPAPFRPGPGVTLSYPNGKTPIVGFATIQWIIAKRIVEFILVPDYSFLLGYIVLFWGHTFVYIIPTLFFTMILASIQALVIGCFHLYCIEGGSLMIIASILDLIRDIPLAYVTLSLLLILMNINAAAAITKFFTAQLAWIITSVASVYYIVADQSSSCMTSLRLGNTTPTTYFGWSILQGWVTPPLIAFSTDSKDVLQSSASKINCEQILECSECNALIFGTCEDLKKNCFAYCDRLHSESNIHDISFNTRLMDTLIHLLVCGLLCAVLYSCLMNFRRHIIIFATIITGLVTVDSHTEGFNYFYLASIILTVSAVAFQLSVASRITALFKMDSSMEYPLPKDLNQLIKQLKSSLGVLKNYAISGIILAIVLYFVRYEAFARISPVGKSGEYMLETLKKGMCGLPLDFWTVLFTMLPPDLMKIIIAAINSKW